MKTDELSVDNSTQIYLHETNMLLDTYALLKRISKYKLKFKCKLWVNSGLQTSTSVKYKLLKDFINMKDPKLKKELQHYKIYRNLLSTRMKESKTTYYDKCFKTNWIYIKNTWTRIKL